MDRWSTPSTLRRGVLRRRMFRVHGWIGLTLAAYAVVVGLTGSILVFRPEIEAWMNSDLTRVMAHESRAPLQPIFENAQRSHPGARFHTVNLPPEPGAAGSFWGHDSRQRSFHVYFDPHSGDLLGSRLASDNVTEWIYKLHAHLLGGAPGERLNGLLAIGLLFLTLTGLILGGSGRLRLPRWTRRTPLGGIPRRALRDGHRVLGLASAGFLVLIALTGVFFPYQAPFRWLAATLTNSPVLEDSPAPRSPNDSGPRISLDAVLAAAATVLPGVPVNWIELPDGPDEAFEARKRLPGEWRLEGMNYIHIDPGSARILRVDLHQERTPAQRLIRALYPLHSGSFGGLPTRLLWVAVGLTPAALAVTGAWMSWKRTRRRHVNDWEPPSTVS